MKWISNRRVMLTFMMSLNCGYVLAQNSVNYEQWKARQELHDQRLQDTKKTATFQQRVVQVESRTPLPIMTVAKNSPALGNELSININTASLQEITAKLDGIGRSKAQAIITYREKHGVFKRKEDLLHVKGIGAKTLEKNKSRIRLN